MPKPQDDDDLVMNLVEQALSQPPDAREAWLREACGRDAELFNQVWDYAQWNHRMQDFLLEPLCPALGRLRGSGDPVDEDATRTMAHSSAAEEHRFYPGDLLSERFRIVREVAQGGMGIVYEALDERLARRIALKCARSGFNKRLPPEVRHASEISHPNVCRIFEIHTASTVHGEIDFFTMEFLEGETLRARLGQGPVPEAEAVAIGRQICAGVAEAHRNHVVHGDLKSNNVILARDAGGGVRAVVTDFGLARGPLGSGPAESTAVGLEGASRAGGTPGYMAPELWKGEKATIASDVYALGVTLYELVANRRPYPPELPWQDREKQSPPAVNHAWNPVLQRCLDPDPARRFRDAGEVAAALEPPRSRRWWWMAAAAAIILAVVSGWVTYQRASAPKESIRLAMLPLEAGPDSKALAERVSRDAAGELARLKGGTRARLSIVSWSDVIGRRVDTLEKARVKPLGATHVVEGTIAWENGKVVVHAVLTDAQSHNKIGDWMAEYAPSEERYVAKAMTGMVTFALGLTPLDMDSVTAKAWRDRNYVNGLTYRHRYSNVDKALPFFDYAVMADPDSPLTWAGLAEAQRVKFFATQDPAWRDRSLESLRQAQNRNLDLAPVHRVTGLTRTDAGLYAQAEAEYLRAIQLEPANGDAHRWLGLVYERNDQLVQALHEYEEAVHVQPGDFKACQDLGAYYDSRGDVSEAALQWEKCVSLAPPDEPEPHRVLGTAYKNLGRYADAERELREAVRLAPTSTSLGALASTLMSLGRDRDAIDYLERATKLAPDEALWSIDLGIAYERADRPQKSREEFRRGLEKAKQALNRDPKNGTARSQRGFLFARLGDGEQAETEIKQALVLFPENTAVQETAVWTYVALGQLDRAVDILAGAPDSVLVDVARWPDLADFRKFPRLQQLITSRHLKL